MTSRLSRRALLAAAALPSLQAASQIIAPASSLSPGDDAFLEDLEKANFQFFWEQSDPHSGLTKDRCRVRGTDSTFVASIAATGFALTALCIGHERDYVSYSDARNRVLNTLRF